jgi:amidase
MASHDTFGPNGVPLNRREVLTLTGAASAVATTQAFTNAASAAAERTQHIVMDDALALADTIRSRQVSCVEVMTDYLDHIEKINPKVNAIVAPQDRAGLLVQASERDAQLARGDLMGPLHGFPYAVKDLALVKGIRTTFGSPILKDFVPTTDSIIVERLRKAGAIFIGKPTRRNSVWARTPTIRCTV